jgi:DNA polymerase-3 subunit delta
MPAKAFTFICGDDDYLVSERGKRWFAEQTKDIADDLAKEVIDGRAGNVAEVGDAINRFTSAVQTLSLFGDQKVIWLKDVNFMAKSQTGNAQGTLDLLETLKDVLEVLDPNQVRVLMTVHPVYKVRNFYKWCQTNAEFTLLATGNNADAGYAQIIQDECKKAGVQITSGAVRLLIDKLNGSTRLMVAEASKLATFVGKSEAPIDERLVMELVPNFGDADFFEAVDAFYSLKLDWMLEALRRHFFTNSESRPLLGSLQSRNRLMIQLRVLLDARAIRLGGRGISKSDLEAASRVYGEHFGDSEEKSNLNVFTQNPWYLGKLAVTASKVSLKKLIEFQIAFAEAFEGIIERPNEQEAVCREMAVRCLG